MTVDKRFSLMGIIEALMVADHLGDVRDEIDHLCDLAGIERPEGGYEEGWTAPWWENDTEDDDEGR